jgi:hypothetical protein
MRCPHSVDLGTYVLGALPESELAEVESHLAGCSICRAELDQIKDMPITLGLVDADTAQALARDGDVVPAEDRSVREGWAGPTAGSIEWAGPTAQPTGWAGPTAASTSDNTSGNGAGARRGRRRLVVAVLAGAAAACLAFVLGVAAPGLVARWRAPQPVAMQQVAAASPVSAQVALEGFDGGTKVLMHCTYTGAGDRGRWTFRLAVVPRSGGTSEEIGTWTAGYGDDVTVTGYTRLAIGDISRVELRRGDGTTLLAYQR